MGSELVRRFHENVRLVKALRRVRRCELIDVAQVAAALRVEPHVLLMSEAERTKWIEEHLKEEPDGD